MKHNIDLCMHSGIDRIHNHYIIGMDRISMKNYDC